MRVSCWEMSLCALPGAVTWNKCAWSFPSAPAQCLWGAVLQSLPSWFWKAEQFFGVDQDTLNLKMLKIHSASSSPFSKMSFQFLGSTWFLSLGDDQECFWPYSLHECCFFISSARNAQTFWTPENCYRNSLPSHHPLFFLQQDLEWDASSCWWPLKLLSISHRGK